VAYTVVHFSILRSIGAVLLLGTIALAHAAGVDMPISHCVARVIAGELTIADASWEII